MWTFSPLGTLDPTRLLIFWHIIVRKPSVVPFRECVLSFGLSRKPGLCLVVVDPSILFVNVFYEVSFNVIVDGVLNVCNASLSTRWTFQFFVGSVSFHSLVTHLTQGMFCLALEKARGWIPTNGAFGNVHSPAFTWLCRVLSLKSRSI